MRSSAGRSAYEVPVYELHYRRPARSLEERLRQLRRHQRQHPYDRLARAPSFAPARLPPPRSGKGSLNFLVGSGSEKVAYGNEIDFAGTPLSSLTAVGFNVYTTGEDIAAGNGTPNMPGIAFEIDPNVTGKSHYSSLVFMPNNTAANTWSYIDATKAESGLWGGTGSAFAGTKCDINGTRCTWDELQAYLKDNNNGTPAKISYSVGVTEGRDFSWQGAIDGLRINGQVFDFEETGVAVHPAA